MSDSFKTGSVYGPSVRTMTNTPRFTAVGSPVADMAAALEFYRLLGLNVPQDAEAEPHVEIPLNADTKLLFDTHETMKAFDGEWAPSRDGRISLAFDCGSPADVDAMYAKITGAGHEGHLAPFDAFWGQRYAVVRDPDGNAVDLYASLS